MLNLYEISLDKVEDLVAYQEDSFILATMTFQANNIGNTTISFGDIWLGDEEGNPLDPDLPLGTIIIDITERNQPVPEPATFMLLGIGLAGMSAVVLRRRKRADKLS